MWRTAFRRVLTLAVLGVLPLHPALTHAQADAARIDALIRDLKSGNYEKAIVADAELAKDRQHRGQVAAGLIDALRTGEWDRCGGDIRDGIARTLGDLRAKEAVIPLLDLVKRGKPIEHECSE